MISNHPLFGVKTRRHLLGLKGTDVAKELGVQPETLMRYENGTRVITFPKALTLAKILGDCDPRDLRTEPDTDETKRLMALKAELDASNSNAIRPAPSPRSGRSKSLIPPTFTPVDQVEPADPIRIDRITGTVVPQQAPKPQYVNDWVDEDGNPLIID
jgi:transcriptional regulator with XRE-family HTH domain